MSGAGIWPLLAVLGSGAAGPACGELASVVGFSGSDAQSAVREFFNLLGSAPEVGAALGIWLRADIQLHAEWAAGLPRDVVRPIGPAEEFDAWASEHTRGLIPRFPIRVEPDDLVVLATAFAAVTRWVQPFDDSWLMPTAGPWQGHRGPALHRMSLGLDSVSVLNGQVTRVIVVGGGGIDVHLLLAKSPTGAVTAGIAALTDTVVAVEPGTELPIGHRAPGLRVELRPADTSEPRTVIELPPFALQSSHDLTEHAALFGLTTALDTSRGHFPLMADTPLAVGQARQSALAEFTAQGFKVAAVTAIAMTAGGVWQPAERALTVEVVFDRPFAFLAVHRDSGLALAAGVVTSPAEPDRLEL